MSAVDHPDHYGGKDNPYEAIKVIYAWTAHMDGPAGMNIGNALKYISRAGKKDPEKTVEDLEKAIWFLTEQIKLEEAKQAEIDASFEELESL